MLLGVPVEGGGVGFGEDRRRVELVAYSESGNGISVSDLGLLFIFGPECLLGTSFTGGSGCPEVCGVGQDSFLDGVSFLLYCMRTMFKVS